MGRLLCAKEIEIVLASLCKFLLCPRERFRSIVMSAYVCVSVCLSVSISLEPHARSLPAFLCMLPVALAQSSISVVANVFLRYFMYFRFCG